MTIPICIFISHVLACVFDAFAWTGIFRRYPLNVAEGNGRWHTGDKRQFFCIARGSAFECIPIIEILKIKNIISPKEYEMYRADLEIIGKMLTRLIQVHTDVSK